MSVPTQSIVKDDAGFPRRLRDLGDAPSSLQVLGRLIEPRRSVAIVGARAASGHGLAAAREIAQAVAAAGGLVVSGGAVGIDGAAHRGALDGAAEATNSAATVAVLGGGLGRLYPAANRPLFQTILDRGGALASPFAHDVPPRPGTFVARNRVIAGMADAVLVVEAGSGSGALHTAAAAVRYGRLVAAMPGSPGTESLIAQGAAVVQDSDDLLAALAGKPRRPDRALPERGSDPSAVLDALGSDPLGADQLSACTGLSARDVNRALTELELEGLALLAPGRSYVRSALAQELLLR